MAVLVWVRVGLLVVVGLLAAVAAEGAAVRRRLQAKRKASSGARLTIGFFHPYCNDGGGGERVLWCGVQALRAALREQNIAARFVVYTGDSAPDDAILSKTKARAMPPTMMMMVVVVTNFGIELEADAVEFVRLHKRGWVEKERWPRFTILGQSLGSMVLTWEALQRCPPDVFIDTMGYAFGYWLARLFVGCQVGCYVHYPTVSTDMLGRAGSVFKMIYYRAFASLYGLMGSGAHAVMVNSSWTANHIRSLWRIPDRTRVVFPPCDTTQFQELKLDVTKRTNDIMSLGQFRPEKDHKLQVRAFARMLRRPGFAERDWAGSVRLLLVGGCRGAADQELADGVEALARDLGVADRVQLRKNVGWDELRRLLEESAVGLHTMWCEHFGIGVVQMMAAGLVVVAHNSGGPRMDIVEAERTGYLAATEEEYAECLERALATKNERPDAHASMQAQARTSSRRFSDEAFSRAFAACLTPLITHASHAP